MLAKKTDVLQNFAEATRHEWIETNGLGGWASSSIIGANTRRYHGLLVASLTPPTKRFVLLSKLDETIITADGRYELGANLYDSNTDHPGGQQYLQSFTKELFPQWEYEAGGIRFKKTIAMVHGENTVVVIYDIMETGQPFTLELLPLMAARNYHSLQHEGTGLHWHVDFQNGIFHNRPNGKTNVFLSVPGSTYQHNPKWFNDFLYSAEKNRGLDYKEDLLNHGLFTVKLKPGDTLGIIISTDDPVGKDPYDLLAKEALRRKLLLSNQPDDSIIRTLTLAADQFIVKRNFKSQDDTETVGATIIAGYHWFTDWGRDTMISLPGLCLSTGRYGDAKKILKAFANSVSQGMLPTRFTDNGEAPEYNNVDGTLWYFIAVYKYLHSTGDKNFILQEILPVLKQIIDWHYTGTRHHIRADASDGLLFAGEEGQQLTWMDARIGNWVVTPRMGKPVEVQALWYNALKIFSELLNRNGQAGDAAVVSVSAEKVKENFVRLFWYEEGSYLYDNIDPEGKPSAAFRPNQLFAISLPFPLLERDKAMIVFRHVEEHLYTPVGLRTLPSSDNNYQPVYGGDQFDRDSAYHEGTVWSWLLGPYVDALMVTEENRHDARMKANCIIKAFSYHLNEAGIGSVSEIFDAEPPHEPRGCIAQAWGVAEVLRVIIDYQLFDPRIQLLKKEVQIAEV